MLTLRDKIVSSMGTGSILWVTAMIAYSAFYAHETSQPTWWISFGNAVLNGVQVLFMMVLILELRSTRRAREAREAASSR
jgi:hypothetical protein